MYNLIINTTFNESLLNQINHRLMDVSKYDKIYEKDYRLLEEHIYKYFDYLTSNFIMFSLNNDLYKVYPSVIKANGDVSAICIIDNNKIAVAIDAVIGVYNPKTSASIFALKGHCNEVTFIHKIDSSKIISSSLDKTLKVWNLAKKNLIYSLNTEGTNIGYIFSTPEDSNTFFLVHYFAKYEVINLSDEKNPTVICSKPMTNENIYDSYDQLKSGDIICGAKGKIVIFPFNFGNDMTPIKKIGSFDGTPLSYCELKPMLIASGLSNGSIFIFDLNNDSERIKMNGHKGGVTGLLKLEENENVLVSTSLDCTIRFWNLKTYTCQETFHFEKMEIMFFKKFDNGIMAVATDKQVSFWQGRCYK